MREIIAEYYSNKIHLKRDHPNPAGPSSGYALVVRSPFFKLPNQEG